MSKFPKWWTHCPTCGTAFIIESEPGTPDLTDPDQLFGRMDCPYDGASLTGWNGDPR